MTPDVPDLNSTTVTTGATIGTNDAQISVILQRLNETERDEAQYAAARVVDDRVKSYAKRAEHDHEAARDAEVKCRAPPLATRGEPPRRRRRRSRKQSPR